MAGGTPSRASAGKGVATIEKDASTDYFVSASRAEDRGLVDAVVAQVQDAG